MKHRVLRTTLALFLGIMSLVAFCSGFFLWLSFDELDRFGWPGVPLVLMIPVSTALFWAAWRLLVASFKQQSV